VTGTPWPRIDTNGTLERAEREWLHTNGAGAYAMSTLPVMHTRRYHGLLVAALDPPVRRYVIVSHADTAVSVGSRVFRLATHQFPGIAATPGYRLLETFAQDPIPRWTFRLGDSILERRLCLVRGENATIMSYTWQGKKRARLSMKPLFAMRPLHEVAREHGGMIQRVSLRQGEVEIQPVPHLPPVVVGHPGVFMGSPDWWRRFEYNVDHQRGSDYHEDLWTPGTFELDLDPGETRYLIFGLERLPARSPAECMAEVCDFLQRQDPGEEHSACTRTLRVAAEQFRADAGARPAVLAGYPWLDMSTRDCLISLPGLYRLAEEAEATKRVLRTVIGARHDGLLTRGIRESGEVSQHASADASLWLFELTDALIRHWGLDDEFLRGELFPAMKSIFERIVGGREEVIWLAPDGLLANGNSKEASEPPLTWMDSRAHGVAVTPRTGIAVELQGLWTRACSTFARLAAHYGEPELSRRAVDIRDRARAAFARRFWCAETRYPYDCISVDAFGPGVWHDNSVRPNALIALAVDAELFTSWQATAIIERVRERLLTPVGIRTLDPGHPAYRGDFLGLMAQRRAAYHQGTCWAFLLGFYARAALALSPNDFELQEELRHTIEQLVLQGPVLGQVAQVGGGDPPHSLGGCPAQAWSVAELLRTLTEQLDC
jgi:predicted glycogen debranching enzyme